jgi:hypothetical protein
MPVLGRDEPRPTAVPVHGTGVCIEHAYTCIWDVHHMPLLGYFKTILEGYVNYIHYDIFLCTALSWTLYRSECERQAVWLHQATSKIFVKFYRQHKLSLKSTFTWSPPPPTPKTKTCHHHDLWSPPPPKTKTCRHRKIAVITIRKPAGAAADPLHKTKDPTTKIAYCFCASGSSGYNDNDNLDHGYITTSYLDIDIKNNVYSNSWTPVNNGYVLTCVHTTPAVTAGGKRDQKRT